MLGSRGGSAVATFSGSTTCGPGAASCLISSISSSSLMSSSSWVLRARRLRFFIGVSPEEKGRGRKAAPHLSSVSRRSEEAGCHAELHLLGASHRLLLGNLCHAVAHVDADALDELIVSFTSGGRACHLAPAQRDGLLATEEHRLATHSATGARRLQ